MGIQWRDPITQGKYPYVIDIDGGAEGNRTPDLVIANDALSQLSYGPVHQRRYRDTPEQAPDNGCAHPYCQERQALFGNACTWPLARLVLGSSETNR